MFPFSIEFDMSDEFATRSARQAWLANGRKLFTPSTYILAGFSAVMHVLARTGETEPNTWWLWLTALPPALFMLLAGGWIAGLWWFPRKMRKRIAHLPHRRVVMEFTDTEFAAETATEQVRMLWSEITEMRVLADIITLKLRGGGELPVPLDPLSEFQLAAIKTRVKQAA